MPEPPRVKGTPWGPTSRLTYGPDALYRKIPTGHHRDPNHRCLIGPQFQVFNWPNKNWIAPPPPVFEPVTVLAGPVQLPSPHPGPL